MTLLKVCLRHKGMIDDGKVIMGTGGNTTPLKSKQVQEVPEGGVCQLCLKEAKPEAVDEIEAAINTQRENGLCTLSNQPILCPCLLKDGHSGLCELKPYKGALIVGGAVAGLVGEGTSSWLNEGEDQ